MLRLATSGDILRLLEIRDSVGESRFTDPAGVASADVHRLIEDRAMWVWPEPDGLVAGFAAADVRDGAVSALFVAPGHEGKGIGRALLRAACDSLAAAGYNAATLSTDPGGQAERHYRAAGWTAIGRNAKGELVFQKPF